MNTIDKIIYKFKREKCSCDVGNFEYLYDTYSNKVYKCLTCGGKEYKLYYRGGTCGINPKLLDFHLSKMNKK